MRSQKSNRTARIAPVAASRAIGETEIIRLSVEGQRELAELLLNPPEPILRASHPECLLDLWHFLLDMLWAVLWLFAALVVVVLSLFTWVALQEPMEALSTRLNPPCPNCAAPFLISMSSFILINRESACG